MVWFPFRSEKYISPFLLGRNSWTRHSNRSGKCVVILVMNPNFKVVARLRAVVLSLAGEGVMLWDTSIMHGFEASSKYSLQELLSPDCMRDVAHLTQQRLHVEEIN